MDARAADLLVYGSCDGDMPEGLPFSISQACVEHDGRTYWIPNQEPNLIDTVRALAKALDLPPS